jgi:hypothetical protein
MPWPAWHRRIVILLFVLPYITGMTGM